jgi:hypothetical protein
MTNWFISSVVIIHRRPFNHLRLVHPWATVMFLCHARRYRAGARSWGLCPCSHWSCQKCVRAPFPISMVVHARYRAVSSLLCAISMLAHGLLFLLHLYQGHRNLKARLNFCRSKMPSPPSRFGLWTRFQLTMAWPFLASSYPCHKNCHLILSILLIAHLDSWKTVRWYTRTDVKTELIRVSLPILFSNFPFHLGNFAATLSINNCSSSLLTFPILSVNPKYLHGNRPCYTWNWPKVVWILTLSHLIGKIWYC